MSDAEELFGEIPKDARVFGIYRDPVDKMVSVFKDFTKSDKTHRLERMSKIFSLTVSEVSDLSFDQFLILSLRFRDHHWDPNSRFLKVDHPNVSLFYYHPEVMGDVERFLGVSLDAKTVNASESLEVSVSPRSATLIRRLFQEDYRNQDYFAGRIVNARSGMSLGTGEDLR